MQMSALERKRKRENFSLSDTISAETACGSALGWGRVVPLPNLFFPAGLPKARDDWDLVHNGLRCGAVGNSAS